MIALPKEMFDVTAFKVLSFNHPVDLKLPYYAMEIPSNMANLLYPDNTFILILNNNGTFNRSERIDAFEGLVNKTNALREAQFAGWPIKVEDMETYNEELQQVTQALADGFGAPVNAHLFIGFEEQGSFGWHTDEGHVACYMVSGTKLMKTRAGNFELNAGDWIVMPEGLEHCAHNLTDTVMISFGTGSHRPSTKDPLWGTKNPSVLKDPNA